MPKTKYIIWYISYRSLLQKNKMNIDEHSTHHFLHRPLVGLHLQDTKNKIITLLHDRHSTLEGKEFQYEG